MSPQFNPLATIQRTVSARSCLQSSQIFNLGSMIAVIAFPLVPLWFAGSIVAYALAAHHPDARVVRYNRIAGYRFYGWAGLLPIALIFSDALHKLAGGTLAMWLWVWALGVLIVVPWGVWDLIRARKERWQDIIVEVERHE